MAYRLLDGISDQVWCNSHLLEKNGLSFWSDLLIFTPYTWDWTVLWKLRWLYLGGALDERFAAFEEAYHFEYGEMYNPITEEFEDITIIGNMPYFVWLSEFRFPDHQDCTPLLYPNWL